MAVFLRVIKGLLAVLILVSCCWASAAAQESSSKKTEAKNQPPKLLPEKIGEFKAASDAAVGHESVTEISGDGITNAEHRAYVKGKDRISVSLFSAVSDAAAYAALTRAREGLGQDAQPVTVGTVGFETTNGGRKIYFYKGQAVVVVSAAVSAADATAKLAEALADTLDKGSGEIPVLVKHLPDWQNTQPKAVYAVSQPALAAVLKNQPVVNALNFTGGAEAVVGNYNSERLAIVEFNTATLATDNDQRIKAKLQELHGQQQPTPTAYRRVGNYAVFVFDSPNEQAANQLIDQVKYEQVVQWLGENPFSYEQATREFTETTLGVFVSVVKASGMALLTTFIVGGFFGTILFRLRRAQQRSREAYSDSDAMIRLNLDELTPESDSTRLIGKQ